MNRYTLQDGTITFVRITKHQARKLWGKKSISLCACKLLPGRPWQPNITILPETIMEGLQSAYDFERERYEFDNVVSSFEYYNCDMNESGYYTAFYLEQ